MALILRFAKPNVRFQFYAPAELKRLKCLTGCRIKNTWRTLKTEILNYQSKGNLDVKILFGKITHLSDSKIKENAANGFVWEGEFHVPLWSMS